MTDDMLLRAGFYFGLAAKELGDNSYALRFIGHAEDITEEIYFEMVHEVSAKLVAAGKLRPDEDAYESWLSSVEKIQVDE